MMIIVNRQGDYISGSINGKQFGVSFDEVKYQAMLALQVKASQANTVEEMKAVIEEFTPLTQESYKELVEHKSPYLMVNKHTNKFYLKYADKVSSKALPQALVDRMLKSIEKEIDITPLVKCWVRFMRNPNYTDKKAKLFAEYISAPYTNDQLINKEMTEHGVSEAVARAKATTTQVAITQEGLLVVYKVSREITKKFTAGDKEVGEVKLVERYDYEVDEFTGMKKYKQPEFAEDRVFEPVCQGQSGDAFHCETASGDTLGHIIKVGANHWLDDWKQVDCNDGSTARPGLHVGGLRYIQGWQNDGSVTHNLFVDPMDIGAIVGLGTGNDGAMRVRRYFVYSSFDGVNRSIYHSSKFAAITDAEYAKMVEEAVKATAMKQKDLDALLDEDKALMVADAASNNGHKPLSAGGVFNG